MTGQDHIKDHAREVEARKASIEAIKAQMETVRRDYTAGIQPFVKKWMQAIARRYIERNPEKALELGRERLSTLKTRLNQLCEDIEGISRDIMSSDEFWPETRELVQQNQRGLRIVLGKLGTLLEEFGLVKTKAQTEEANDSWSQYDSAGHRREFDGTLIYPHSIDLPKEMEVLLERYRVLIQQKQTLAAEIKTITFEKMQDEATDLWDSI